MAETKRKTITIINHVDCLSQSFAQKEKKKTKGKKKKKFHENQTMKISVLLYKNQF